MTIIMIVVGIVLVVGFVAWALLNRKHPENTASHRDGSMRATDREPMSSPGGPGAERE